jgi:long-subunit acyl-CoA synthetase (AMP-forming)
MCNSLGWNNRIRQSENSNPRFSTKLPGRYSRIQTHCACSVNATLTCAEKYSVPAVWEKIKKKVDASVAAKPALVRALFWTGFKLKAKMLDWGMSGSLFNPLFKKVREATGGSVRLTISGGAPLALETQKFLSVTHAPLLVGYGLTETTAYSRS